LVHGRITEAEYLYNALGQQVHRTVSPSGSAVVTLSVHDLNGNRIAEYDGSGTLLREYLWLDGRPLAVARCPAPGLPAPGLKPGGIWHLVSFQRHNPLLKLEKGEISRSNGPFSLPRTGLI
jgi:hypothetical protein